MVICAHCQHVILSPYNPVGASLCGLIQDYRKALSEMNLAQAVKSAKLDKALKIVDRHKKFDYPNVPRNCERFTNKTPAAGELLTGVSNQSE